MLPVLYAGYRLQSISCAKFVLTIAAGFITRTSICKGIEFFFMKLFINFLA